MWLDAPDSSRIHGAFAEKRSANCGDWFLKSQDFAAWRATPGSFVWLHGNLGSRKSKFSSAVIDHLHYLRQYCSPDASFPVLYFYFDFADNRMRLCEGMMRSLIVQLLSQYAGVSPSLQFLYASHANVTLSGSFAHLLEALHEMMYGYQEVYLVIDALDEFQDEEELLVFLQQFTEWQGINHHILMTSQRARELTEIGRYFGNQQAVLDVQMTESDIQDELRTYVHARVESAPDFRNLQEIVPEIEEQITMKAEGSYVSISMTVVTCTDDNGQVSMGRLCIGRSALVFVHQYG